MSRMQFERAVVSQVPETNSSSTSVTRTASTSARTTSTATTGIWETSGLAAFSRKSQTLLSRVQLLTVIMMRTSAEERSRLDRSWEQNVCLFRNVIFHLNHQVKNLMMTLKNKVKTVIKLPMEIIQKVRNILKAGVSLTDLSTNEISDEQSRTTTQVNSESLEDATS